MYKAWPWFALAAGVLVADQVTKAMVLARFAEREGVQVTSFFNLVLVYNKGAAFSFLSDAPGWQTPLLIAFAIAAIAVVGYLIVRSPERKLFSTGLGLVLGGALGNLVDRVRFGKVVDFLDFHLGGAHWPAFNVADSAITIAVVLILLDGFRKHERRARAPS